MDCGCQVQLRDPNLVHPKSSLCNAHYYRWVATTVEGGVGDGELRTQAVYVGGEEVCTVGL